MIIKNAKIFYKGRFVEGGIEYGEKILRIGNNTEFSGDFLDAKGMYIIPGLVDIHSHAAMNEDASDGKPEGIAIMAKYYAERGVTSWCPTTMTLSEKILSEAMKAIAEYKREPDGAKVAGINLEGPFICYSKKGAQNAEYLQEPDAEMFRRLNSLSGGKVRIITVAPEIPNALEFIREVSGEVTVSLGHTASDYDTAMKAFEAGAHHVTHLFNAMEPLHHRNPGIVAAAKDADVSVELICDGFHIHPAVIRLCYALYGEKLVLISDSARCAGMPEGEYDLGGQSITLKDGKAMVTGTNTIAASSIHLMDAVLRCIKFGVEPEKVIYAATMAPAKVIGMEKSIGSLESGKAADFIMLTPEWEIVNVCIDGQFIHE